MKKCGRPPKRENPEENRDKIIRAAIALVETQGADAVTVRQICSEANLATGTFYYHFKNKDDLMMYFVRGLSFAAIKLHAPLSAVADRIAELYAHLFCRYESLGVKFMRSFYTPTNEALFMYMGETEGKFAADTVMARCEAELLAAQEQGFLTKKADAHRISLDICTIAKGCIFEWCLGNGQIQMESGFSQILEGYIKFMQER